MIRNAALITFLLAILAAIYARPARAENHLDAATIKAGLRTATVEEEGFVQRVLDKVSAGKLPASTVEGVFLWARRKPKNKFQYFRRAIILKAAQSGVDLS